MKNPWTMCVYTNNLLGCSTLHINHVQSLSYSMDSKHEVKKHFPHLHVSNLAVRFDILHAGTTT